MDFGQYDIQSVIRIIKNTQKGICAICNKPYKIGLFGVCGTCLDKQERKNEHNQKKVS